LYVFWNKDGSIDHLAYHLKPNSKNVKYEELTAFLADFRNNYRSPLKFDAAYCNYSAGSFPVMVEKSVGNSNGN
jgi:hypothetical protein